MNSICGYIITVRACTVVNVMVKEHREEVGQLQEYIQGSY